MSDIIRPIEFGAGGSSPLSAIPKIGLFHVGAGVLFFVLAGTLALIIRAQLAAGSPNQHGSAVLFDIAAKANKHTEPALPHIGDATDTDRRSLRQG